MLKILLLLTKDFLFPGLFLIWLWKREYKSKFEAFFVALMAGSYIAFIFFTGDWHIYGIYFRYLLSILFLALAGRAFVRVKKLPFLSLIHI